MWSLRRTSIHLRNGVLTSWTSQVSCGKSEIVRSYLENCGPGFVEAQEKPVNGLLLPTLFCNRFYSSSKSCGEVPSFSSLPAIKRGDQRGDELEYAFSEVDSPQNIVQKASSVDHDDDFISESELSENEDGPDDLVTSDAAKWRSSKVGTLPKFVGTILDNYVLLVGRVMDKWVEEGNEVTEAEVSLAFLHLRKRRMYVRALELSEWLESSKHVAFDENNYASHVDLLAKVRGTIKAEEYIEKIPESFRSERVYGSLLANYVLTMNIKKSEKLFNKMRNLGLPITAFCCNKMLALYRKSDKKKIADILKLMEKEEIKRDVFTYQILIDEKGRYNDIAGMELLVETMKAEGLEPPTQINASVAQHYTNSGLRDKAEAILKEIEGDDIKERFWTCKYLLPIYATLGREDEVNRIWEACKGKAGFLQCMVGIEAWGKLKRVDKAEEVFDQIIKKARRPLSKYFVALLKVYADHKMLEKGKDLVKKMNDSGCKIGPTVWDALVKLYIHVGELEKADSMLDKFTKEKKGMFTSYYAILNQYAKRGDINNAERMFLKMRQVGYLPRLRQYITLLEAYTTAKAPVYGFRERMTGDGVLPNKFMNIQLARANTSETTGIYELMK